MSRKGVEYMRHLPFHIDITHVFSSDAFFIQNDICCVPNDGSQEVSVLKTLQHFIFAWIIIKHVYFSFLRCVALLGFTWVNNTRRPWQTEVFGKNVNPHLDLSLYLTRKHEI